MTKKHKKDHKKRRRAYKRLVKRFVLPALAAVVVALTIYAWFCMKGTGKPKSPPTLAQGVLAKARGLMKARQYGQARNIMRAHVLGHGDDTEVRPLLAEAQFMLGELDHADRTVADLLALAPENAGGLWMKGRIIHRREGKGHMEYFRRAADQGDGLEAGAEIWARYGVELLSAGRTREGKKYLTKALTDGVRDARTLGGLGELAVAEKQFEVGEKYLSEALTDTRTDPRLWVMLAKAQMNLGKTAAAAKTAEEALNIRRNGPLLVVLGEVRMLQKRREEAADAYAQAAGYDDVAAVAAYRAATCYYLLEKYDRATKYAQLATRLRPDDPRVKKLIAKIEKAWPGPPPATGPALRLP